MLEGLYAVAFKVTFLVYLVTDFKSICSFLVVGLMFQVHDCGTACLENIGF